MTLDTKQITDASTGLTYRSIGREGSHTTHHYFTAMTWRPDSSRLILSTDVSLDAMLCSFVSYDLTSGESVLLEENASWGGGVVSLDDRLYYLKNGGIRGIDLTTQETVLTIPAGDDRVYGGPLSITNDGRTLGLYWKQDDRWTIGWADVRTGEVHATLTPGFTAPYEVANHAMVNPEHPHLIFYAHEGRTQDIPDRIWLADTSVLGGNPRNLYDQRMLQGGELGEYVGHEAWSFDGERLYFVRYSSSPLSPKGLGYVNRQGTESGNINGDYRHWHAAPSPDGRWLVSDTESDDHTSKIVLTEVATGRAEVLCEVKRWPHHPGHPHPSFSVDSRKIAFIFADEADCLRVGCIDLSSSVLGKEHISP
ncbi:hypothetical protein WMW72_02985 [Paenibacillus filicis]|uniref:Oligogalacturonate lyase n=1 Tax=Paenibacillus filicis TaxID=669464 RepID=A0ABU9DDE8_9BACL